MMADIPKVMLADPKLFTRPFARTIQPQTVAATYYES